MNAGHIHADRADYFRALKERKQAFDYFADHTCQAFYTAGAEPHS